MFILKLVSFGEAGSYWWNLARNNEKLERIIKLGKFKIKFISFQFRWNFPTPTDFFHFHSKFFKLPLSDFSWNFPTQNFPITCFFNCNFQQQDTPFIDAITGWKQTFITRNKCIWFHQWNFQFRNKLTQKRSLDGASMSYE